MESTVIRSTTQHLVAVCNALESVNPTLIDKLVAAVLHIRAMGGHVYLVGNGGSAATASHAAVDLLKLGVRAQSLADSGPTLTMLVNDYPPAEVFSRQLDVLAESDDLLIAISASGQSANIMAAVRAARDAGCYVVGLTGKAGPSSTMQTLGSAADLAILVESNSYGVVEDVHAVMLHAVAAAIYAGDVD
jgi:D-sedoheptulose 7-phosphate isomerase